MLKLKNIKKTYVVGDFKQVALDDVSIDFRTSEFASILGPSGSGKTTLLNIIGGLDHYDTGDLIINGISTKKYKESDWDSYRNHRIGFVFQSYNLISHQSVLSNVELALTLSGVSKKTRIKRAKEALAKVGLERHINKKPNQLSGGQMQRVAIARALVNNPDILLADEPTGALDSETSRQIMEILKEISKDKLVIMVTHNPELASEYSTRIINLKDGKVTNDSNPYNDEDEKNSVGKKAKTSMSLLTALSLSLNNLMTKKGRTILTAFAGSIGIIGIALILSLSSGMRSYIDKTQKETLANYPLTIEKQTYDLGESFTLSRVGKQECNSVCTYDDITTNQTLMALSNEVKNDLRVFKKAIEANYHNINDYVTGIDYNYNVKLRIFDYKTNEELNNIVSGNGNVTSELIASDELMESQYELLEGVMPKEYNELILILDNDGNIPLSLLYNLRLIDGTNINKDIQEVKKGNKKSLDTPTFTYEDFIGKTYSLVLNNLYFEKINGVFSNISTNKDKMNSLIQNGISLKIVGVAKLKSENQIIGGNFLGYRKDLVNYVISENLKSEIGQKQIDSGDINIFTGYEFDKNYSKESVYYLLGIATYEDPDNIVIYPKNYAAKDEIKNIIKLYNEEHSDSEEILYTDYVGLIMSSVTSVIDVITYILVAFVAISLIVSSIMISIITYISVLERTKEIGILRSIGASKRDVTRVFNAETIIEGFVAGVFGILVTLLLCIPINKTIYSLYGVDNIAKLPIASGFILIGISVVLTLIAGLIPSRMAAKKDPVEALRTE